MSRPLLIRCDYFEGSGVGHLRRCSTLAGALKDFELEPRLLLDSGTESLPLRATVPIDRTTVAERFDENGDAAATIRLARQIGAVVVVVDSYRITRRWVDLVRAEGFRVAVIDDLGIGVSADLTVNYSPDAGKPSKDYEGVYLGGLDYFITNSSILAPRGTEPRMMMLHAGGTGRFAAAEPVYAAAAAMGRRYRLALTWLAPDNAAHAWLKAANLLASGDEVVGWRNDTEAIWQPYDLVVGPASTSVFEAVMQGALPISFAISETQSASRETWIRIGHPLHLTRAEANAREFAERLIALGIERHAEIRAALTQHSSALDGRGAERVARAICCLADDRRTESRSAPSQAPAAGIRACDIRDAVGWLHARNAPHVRARSTDSEHIIAWPEQLSWWLATTTQRFVVQGEGGIEAYFWHQPRRACGRDYLIGGWFPVGEKQSFAAAVRLLEWQLAHAAQQFPDHLWLATIHRSNKAVLALNRRYGFIDADDVTRAAAEALFPGTSAKFEILQRKSRV